MRIKSKRKMTFMVPTISILAMLILLTLSPSEEQGFKWLIFLVTSFIGVSGAILFSAANIKIVGSKLQVCTFNHVSREIDLNRIVYIDVSADKSDTNLKTGVQPQVMYLNFIVEEGILLRFSKKMYKDEDILRLIAYCQQINPRIEVDLSYNFFAEEKRRKVR